MKDKFVVHLTKMPQKNNEITLTYLIHLLLGYFKKVFWYAKAQIVKRRRSYRSMFLLSIIMLSFVFINLILNEARIMGALSNRFGGVHHVSFLGIDGTQAKGAAEHKKVVKSLIIPVIATLESSVDSTTVGKVAVLTDEAAEFMQVGITHGILPGDNEIIVPRHIYSNHNFLILGKEQDMYFDAAKFVYRSMTMSGIYSSTDSNSPYLFVNEKTGEEIKQACGNKVTFDVFLVLDYASDRNAAKVAGDIIRKYDIHDTEEQRIDKDDTTERGRYRDYVNIGAANYRFSDGMDINRLASYPAVVIAALIMASFMTNYTERHISEYGVLASYGAKRRHLFGVVIGQVLFITILSMIPVLLLSLGVSWIYVRQYNLARLESNLPAVMSLPTGTIFRFALLYIVILCLICSVTMNRMLSQFPYPMVRGSTDSKIPFVKKSSEWIEKVKDKVRHISVLQSLRTIRRSIIPALATSIICIVCAGFIGYNFLQVLYYQNRADEYADKQFDGRMSAIWGAGYEDGFWRGFINAEDIAYVHTLDGVKAAGGLRSKIEISDSGLLLSGRGTFEILVDEAHAAITDDSDSKFRTAHHLSDEAPKDMKREYEQILKNGYMTPFQPYYCDEDILSYLYLSVLEGNVHDIYTVPNSIILVDNTWTDDAAHYHAGDIITVRGEKSGRIEMTVAAIVTGNHLKDLYLTMSNGCAIMSPETGERMDGFPADLRTGVYFQYDSSLTDEEYQTLSDEIADNVNIIRYDVEFYHTQRLKATKMATLENTMTGVFFAMLYIAMCVLDYYHSNESILAQRKEFCTLRQIGARERDIRKTTRMSVYAGQVLSLGFTIVLAFLGAAIVSGYCANLSNTYRMTLPEGETLRLMLEMVREAQRQLFRIIAAVFTLSLPLHILAMLTAVAGTILPTKRILSENIAQTLKGDAEL